MAIDPPSIEKLEIVADGLKELLDEVVFIGGATASLYMDSKAAPEPRPTDDVDCIIEVGNYSKYAKLEERLRQLGFSHDTSKGAPVCRKIYHGIKVDVMPTDDSVLGFSNRWYQEGIKAKEKYILQNGKAIWRFALPYFIASKLEAFKSRGKKDPRHSSDLEDIILVFDGCTDPIEDLNRGSSEVKRYLAKECKELLKRKDFIEVIEGFLSSEGAGRIKRIEKIFFEVSAMA